MPLSADHHPFVELNAEESAVLERVRQLVAEEIGPKANSVGREDKFAWDTFRLLSREGLIANGFPREYGGIAATMMLRARIVEELARACSAAAAMLVGTDGSASAIIAAGSKELQREVLPRLASGERQCAFALTEPHAGSDLGNLKTIARPVEGGVRITGMKKFITRANVSDYFVVIAREPNSPPGTRHLMSYLVDRKAAGLTVSDDVPKLGWYGLPIAGLRFEDVFVPPERQLGERGVGMTIAQDLLLRARISHAAIALGRMTAALQIATQYTSRRQVKGQPISDHQGVQWMIADMGARIEAVRCTVYAAARRYDHGDADVALHGSIAKMLATDLSMKVSIDCLQLLGANGYLKEYPLERFVRDAKFNQIGEGTSEIHKNIIGAALTKIAADMPLHPCLDIDPAVFAA